MSKWISVKDRAPPTDERDRLGYEDEKEAEIKRLSEQNDVLRQQHDVDVDLINTLRTEDKIRQRDDMTECPQCNEIALDFDHIDGDVKVYICHECNRQENR